MPRVDLRHAHPMFFVAVIGDLILFFGMGLSLALGPHHWFSTPNLDGVAAIMPIRLWGVVYFTLGCMMTFGLLHSWRWARRSLVVGSAIVMGWAASFVVLAFQGKNTGVTGIFSYVALATMLLAQTGEPPSNPLSSWDD